MATDLIGHDIDIRIIRSVITQYQFIVSLSCQFFQSLLC